MKCLIHAFVLVVCVSSISAQTTPKPEQVVELKGNLLLREDFMYQDSNFVYFQKDNNYFKISQSKVISSTGIKVIPTSTYYEDMFHFTKQGLNAVTLSIIGILTTTGGSLIAIKTESINLGIGFIAVGTVISFAGLITEISAWSAGKEANIKMIAVEY